MSQTTTQSRQRPSSFRSWSTLLAPKRKSRSDTPQSLPITPRASDGSDEETPDISSSRSSGSDCGTSNHQSDGLPSYAHAVLRSKPTPYRFIQESPFSMCLVKQEGASDIAYNISVSVNVWMPSEYITLVRRRAGPDGPVLAQIEMGITSATATVTIGDQTMALSDLMFGMHSSPSSRKYLLKDGRAVKWTLGATTWQASLDNSPLATFSPNSRNLTLQPRAHSDFDDIVVSILILMREHLTPKSIQVGGAAGLFNYHPFSKSNE